MRNRIASLKHDADLALQRFADLRERSADGDANPRLLDEVLEELSVALHELQAGSDELREQNERLLVAENRLSEERRRYQELFEFGPDGYLVTTATAVIREANRMAARNGSERTPSRREVSGRLVGLPAEAAGRTSRRERGDSE